MYLTAKIHVFNFRSPHSPNSSLLSKAKSTALGKSLTTQYSTNQWFHRATPRMWAKYQERANQTKFLSVGDIWFPTGVSTLCHCHVVGSSGNRFFFGWVGKTLTLKLLRGIRTWTTCDWFKGWAPRLCLFRAGQLKSLAIQIPLNEGLSRISSSTSKNVSSFVYHELLFSLLYF